jgi:hypothetical protein
MEHYMDNQQEDKSLLHKLNEAVQDIADEFEQHDDVAMLVLGSKIVEPNEGEEEDVVHTYIMMVGFYESLMEGLYAELRGQVENNNYTLFACIRQVVRDIEEEMGIDPDDDIMTDEEITTLH